MTKTTDIIRTALKFGAHREGCPRILASLNTCECGWSDARLGALRLTGELDAFQDHLSKDIAQ